jgi:hypothetical protein
MGFPHGDYRHADRLRIHPSLRGGEADEAIQLFLAVWPLDCFAEPVIGPAEGRTRWLAMTKSEAHEQ